ncbi:MAG: hypothetical protein PHG16_07185 [Lachnospiraceae bacterium]|nr:hypothetical protein [Lachnospiraceae bacterium]
MREESYEVKCPRHIVFGDPLYFEEFKGERLKELVVNFKPPQYFKTGVILKEEEVPECPGFTLRTMSIYLAPKETLGTYLSGKMYEGQQIQQKEIGVDSACYIISVDGREEDIKTGGDGYWGDMQTFYHLHDQRKVKDAVILTVVIPDFVDFKDMQKWVNYFFEDVQLLKENKKEQKKDVPER